MGKHFGELPADSMLTFLNSQGLQSPLLLEADWLLIGHVDEFVQFLPFANNLSWTIAIADTTTAMTLLKEAQAAGHGDAHAISFVPPQKSADGFLDTSELSLTINDVVANETIRKANQYAQPHIDSNLHTLLSEINLRMERVIRVPTLFKAATFELGGDDDGLPPHTSPLLPGEMQLMAFFPAAINGIVIGKHYLSPKPWGPVVNGKTSSRRQPKQHMPKPA
ncbi:hypothetical protein CNMCM5623_008998 [Aspergillus felis]|uniref:Protein-arginine deiminase C-terminal domain-containing protein n=1 Tax=Aspergillus felis TaxID=1287682 RepID=A0A8H6QX47_9EURO|nr:hypothetical protein CNMCM5623_008998 [Aspergillus felis]KAF7180653.1 hypothetical protein CNMCM7691_009944 [Aspergillus felis]